MGTILMLYFWISVLYGLFALFRDDNGKELDDMASGWDAVILWALVGFGWPYFLTQQIRRRRAEIRRKQAALMKKRDAEAAYAERVAAVKMKADAAEESWKYINDSVAKRTAEKRTRNQAEHNQWDADEKQALEDAYRKLNFSGIREARLRARQAGLDGEANMLNRILDDKTIEAVSNDRVLDSLTPDERQLVAARMQEIYRERQRRWGYGYIIDHR